jgi:hypothetical protein
MPDGVAKPAAANEHLSVGSTVPAGGAAQTSLVSSGVSTHQPTGRKVVAFVALAPGCPDVDGRHRSLSAARNSPFSKWQLHAVLWDW